MKLAITTLLAVTIMIISSTPAVTVHRAAIVSAGLPGESLSLTRMIAERLEAEEYLVSRIDGDTICDSSKLTVEHFDLLVVTNGASLPTRSASVIEEYLNSGGNIIALNAPLWSDPMVRRDDEWIALDKCLRMQAKELPQNILFDFSPESISSWTRASQDPGRAANYETVHDGPAPGVRALHAEVSDLWGWDNFGPRSLNQPFPKGHTLTVFSAKGGPDTPKLAVEWAEEDGSRWVCVIPLEQDWRQYVLQPSDFHYWSGGENRGSGADTYRPENAVALTFGLSFTHTGALPGRHEYWVGPVGTAEMGKRYADLVGLVGSFDSPKLDTISPTYKFFDVNDLSGLFVRTDQVVASGCKVDHTSTVRSSHPRVRGGGFDKGRDWRWIPILNAQAIDGEWRGNPATMLVRKNGGMWASFGIGDIDFYKQSEALDLIGQIARRMRGGVFFIDAGSNFYTYFADQQVRLGANVVNVGKEAITSLTVRISVSSSDSLLFSKEMIIGEIAPGQTARVEDNWLPDLSNDIWDNSGAIVRCELLRDGEVIDLVVHELNMWAPKPKHARKYVQVKDGNFVLDGKRWRPHGVNYMPSSGVAMEDWPYYEYWLGARSYDPEVIQRDLEHIRDMNLNSVSVFIYEPFTEHQNLLDFLLRCERLGLKVNLSLRPGTPMDFKWPEMRHIIEYYRLWENDTVFAYDLAWEPNFGDHWTQQMWDKNWERWIIERYGSIENAEKDWGYSAPRDNGKVTNPLTEQILNDGEWRRMVAAYRRFLDTLLYKKYSAARRLVKSIDPNHLVSFRMAEAGNPTYHATPIMPYDFPYLAAAVDILEPEAYGRIGDWDAVKPGWFEYEYARWAAPDKPMFWAEMGVSVWDIADMQPAQDRLDFQAFYHETFYRMMCKSGADGIFYWWYAGGFRVGENSDFGIINPDGKDRPVSKVVRNNAQAFLNAPDPKQPDHWIEFDRDLHPRGLPEVYNRAKDEFWQAIADGKTPGLRTAGTGTDSATCPLVAVGSTECNGSNPPKYMDAVFDVVEVLNASDKWVTVDKGANINVRKGEPLSIRVSFTNLGEAELLAPDKSGASGSVYLTVSACDRIDLYPLKADLARHESVEDYRILLSPCGVNEPTEVTLSFTAKDRTPFGEKYRLVAIPENSR